MSEIVKEVQKFFEGVQEGTKRFTSIPDSGLQQKIKRVSEGSGEIIQYIKEKSDPKRG